MTAIGATNSVLPSAPAPTPTAPTPAIATPQPQVAAPASIAGAIDPETLDQPDSTYPNLITSHVAVFRALGTPEQIIAELNASEPSQSYLDQYLQGEIMQNPEGWDQVTGQPAGTARAGLQQLLPGVQLPAPGQGTPGYLPDGSVVGPDVPGVTAPLVKPGDVTGGGLESGIKGLVWGAAALGVGLLGYKFMKGRGASEAVKAGAEAAQGGGGAAQSLKALEEAFLGGKGAVAGEALEGGRALLAQTVAGGGGMRAQPAMMDQIIRGALPAQEEVSQLLNASVNYNVKPEVLLRWDLGRRAVDSGQLAHFVGPQSSQAGAASAIRDVLGGIASLV